MKSENWKKVRLGDILLIQKKSKIKASDGIENGIYPFFTCSNDIVRTYNSAQYKGPALIFGTGGKASVHFCDTEFSTSTDCLTYYPVSSEINLDLVNQYIQSNIYLLENGFKGAGLKHVSRDYIANIEINLPDIKTQDYIVQKLNKAKNIISNSKQLLTKYDLLIKSRFIEMFGDDKYPKIHISDMVEGKVDSAKKIFDKKDEIKYIDISSVDNKINEIIGYTECVFEEAPSRAQQHIRQNDILISTVRPNLKNIAINKLPYTETVASSGFCVLRPKYVPEYLFLAVLQDKFTNDMVAVTTGANYPAIKDSDILNYEIANPPIELQNSFAVFVQQIDKSKFTVQKSLEKAETLYKSLMQEYFA